MASLFVGGPKTTDYAASVSIQVPPFSSSSVGLNRGYLNGITTETPLDLYRLAREICELVLRVQFVNLALRNEHVLCAPSNTLEAATGGLVARFRMLVAAHRVTNDPNELR